MSAEKGERVLDLVGEMRHSFEIIEQDFTTQADAMIDPENCEV